MKNPPLDLHPNLSCTEPNMGCDSVWLNIGCPDVPSAAAVWGHGGAAPAGRAKSARVATEDVSDDDDDDDAGSFVSAMDDEDASP